MEVMLNAVRGGWQQLGGVKDILETLQQGWEGCRRCRLRRGAGEDSSGSTMAAVGPLGCLERGMKRPERPTDRRSAAASSKSQWWRRKSMPMMGKATSARRKVAAAAEAQLLLLVAPAAENGVAEADEAGTRRSRGVGKGKDAEGGA